MNALIKKSLQAHQIALDSLDESLISKINISVITIIDALKKGNKILWCGNGGSASQANHLSAELIGGMYKNKKEPYRSLCLNTDNAFITAWSNDDSFDNIFSRQIESLGLNGDILFALSTSGNSANIINACKLAQSNSIKVISLTGKDGGIVKGISDININIQHESTQRIQEMHILIGHIICDIIEQSL